MTTTACINPATRPTSVAHAVEAHNVAADYAGILALDQVNLDIQVGRFTAIIGPNGAGKSTLLKLLTGTKRPLCGYLRVCGLPIAEARKANAVAYVPQETAIDWDYPITVQDVVLSGRYGHSRIEGGFRRFLPPAFIGHRHREIAQRAMQAMQIEDLAQRPIGALSGGQKKRVFLARSLAQEPRIMLLDEPLAGVDRRSEGIILEHLKRFVAAGQTVIMVTHDLPTVRDCADWVVLISGTVVGVGEPDEMLTPEALERGYHRGERTPA